MKQRVSWNEKLPGCLVHIIADQTAEGWEFSEQEAFELQWFPRTATPELVAKAQSLLGELQAHRRLEQWRKRE